MKLAKRMDKLGTENAFVVLAEVNKLVSEGKDIISFCIGEPDFDTPRNIKDAAIKAINGGYTHYGPSAGLPEAWITSGRSVWEVRDGGLCGGVCRGVLACDTKGDS